MLSAKLTEGLCSRHSQIRTHLRRPRRISQISVGAGFYPARARCANKSAQQTAITQYVRRGRCPHRPGRLQLQTCTHHRRNRTTSCRGGRLCPPIGATANLPQCIVKRTCPVRADVGIDPYKHGTVSHWCVRVRGCIPPGGQRRPPLQNVMRGRRLLCNFGAATCAGGAEPLPYAK